MPFVLVATLSIHVLAGVFWAGTSFVLARTGGSGGDQLFAPQMVAALIAVIAGAYLWSAMPTASGALMLGAAAALIAAAVQAALGGRALRLRRQAAISEASAEARIAVAQRIAAGLLAVTIITMVAAPYV
jgi:hypothetical protein